MSWAKFYKNRIGEKYTEYCKVRYREFILVLEKTCATRIAEEGCGIGTITKCIHRPHMRLKLFDLHVGQVALARRNLKKLKVDIFPANIFDYLHVEKQDLIFSHGVLEHFCAKDIEKILQRQRRQAKTVIHYVPTDKYPTTSFGDENLKPVGWWVSNFKPIEHKTFNDGKDLILVFKE